MKGRETRYWSNERKKNAKLKKDEVQCIEAKEGDEVQCIEACHRGWKRWSSLLAEMTRRPEPVGENRSRDVSSKGMWKPSDSPQFLFFFCRSQNVGCSDNIG